MSASLGRPSGGPLINWLEALEKDFDKTFVDLDLLLGDIDSEQVLKFLLLKRCCIKQK